MRRRAAAHGRTLQLYSPVFVLARDTEQAAQAELERINADRDLISADNILRILKIRVGGDSRADRGYNRWSEEALLRRLVVSFFQPLVIGTPEQVATRLVEYAHAGLDGLMLNWFDFLDELEYFGARILPLLEEAGVRAATGERAL